MTRKDVRTQLKQRLADARAYERVFATPEGQRVLHDILRAGGILAIAHVAGDPFATAFQDGRRSLALHIIDQLRWNEAALNKLAQAQADDDMREQDHASDQ